MSRGPATQQPHNFRQVAPLLGILRLPTCQVGTGGPTSEALVGFFFFFFFYLFILTYFFLAVLGLRCCARVFSSCGERGLLFVAVCGLLIAVASLVVEHGL